MLMKRQFASVASIAPTHMLVKHTGADREQKFSHRMVEQGLVDGWLQLDGNTLTISGDPQDLVYEVQRTPGYYAKSTGDAIPISPTAWARMLATGLGDLSAQEAKAWLVSHGLTHDDYEVTHAYECVLAAEQHEQFAINTTEG